MTSVSAVTNRHKLSVLKCHTNWDFPGGPVVKTLPSSAGGVGLIPGQGAKIPQASWPKSNVNSRSNIVTNSTKTFKMVHIKKKKSLKVF